MSIFNTLHKGEYIKNMVTMSKTNLSLLNTLNELQTEYEKVIDENNILKVELAKFAKK